uniref:Ig-like domain-containing protein n=1 Tax=Terrapene triunguis TaxID=2587831 RepID=A0A674JMR7_9SAUR
VSWQPLPGGSPRTFLQQNYPPCPPSCWALLGSQLPIIVPQRSGTTRTTTSFPCHVWGFYPQDIAVTWLRDGRVRTESTYSPLQRNPDGTFNLTLTYTFTPTFRDRGSILTCCVSHSALAQPLRTLSLSWRRVNR